MHCRSVVCFWFSNNLCVFLLQSAAACGMEAQSDAIQPSHIREAIRRYGHKIGPLSPFTVRNNRAIKSYIYNLKELWFSSGQMKKLWNCWEQFVVTVIFFIKVASFSREIKLCNFCLFLEGQKGFVFFCFVFLLNIIFFQLQIMLFFLLLLLVLEFSVFAKFRLTVILNYMYSKMVRSTLYSKISCVSITALIGSWTLKWHI